MMTLFIWLLVIAPFIACTKADTCASYEYMTVTNAVTGENETREAAWCTGTVTCDDRTRSVKPFKAPWTGNGGPCNRRWLDQWGGTMPANCRDLKLKASPVCLEDRGQVPGESSGAGVIVTVGAASGGDFPADGFDQREDRE
ncbi:hypothetical protein [Sorangium sp. So ce1153]|uniref:hypothetical protein n=1 Tax=Sorangium sp. So ce1153 TaxID=3133333 RepID=UPI003F62EFAF